MKRKLLVADLLCGAGGSSTGCARAVRALGLEMELVCLNHWPTAIETHTRNHPEARHFCQDIATVRPHLIVPEGYLDLLMASPTCTHHSVARGGKPTSDQQRSDPWHIITWFTELRVKRAIIENVWEFTSWSPVDARTGRPVKSRRGEYFRAWVDTIWKLGATSIEWRKLNSANYGGATTRQRFIMKIRFDRVAIGWAPITHHKREEGNLELFPSLKPWRPAREIIDWQIKGRSIFNRKKPLAVKTLARIYAGAVKFNWPEPFLILLRNHMAVAAGLAPAPDEPWIREMEVAGLVQPGTPEWEATRPPESTIVTLRNNMDAQSVDEPTPTIAANGTHIGLAQAVMLANRNNNAAKNPNASPVPCLTTAHGGGIAIAEPVIISPRHGKDGAGPRPRGVSLPLPTITAGGSQVAIAEPVIVNMKGRSTASDVDLPLPTQTSFAGHIAVAEPVIINGRRNNKAKGVSTEQVPTLDSKGGVWLAEPFVMSTGDGAPRSTDDPIPTITTGGAGSDDPGCARPMLVEPFILNRHGTNDYSRGHAVDEPMPTADCRGAGYLVEPFILSQASGGAPRATNEPVPAIPCDGAHALISPYYGSGSGETCRSAREPLPTVTSKARFGVVVPVTNGNGGPGPRSVDDPIPTMTTAKGGEFAIVMPVTHHDTSDRVRDANQDPLPTLTGANRGELAFIAAQFGERQGQTPRIHDIDGPAPAICATGHINLVEGTPHYDILFRMLEPHELAAAMGFNSEESRYEFAGTKTEQIKQIGNAVSVEMMEAEVRAIMADAAVKPVTRSKAHGAAPMAARGGT